MNEVAQRQREKEKFKVRQTQTLHLPLSDLPVPRSVVDEVVYYNVHRLDR